MNYYFLILLFLLITHSTDAQRAGMLTDGNYGSIRLIEKKMQRIGYQLMGDSLQENRLRGGRELIKLLVEALKYENSFRYAFDSLPFLAKVYPEDSSFRIFTFQTILQDYTYRHYGAVQINRSKIKLIPFKDYSDTFFVTPQSQLTNKNWLGAVYYRCFTKSVQGKPMYFLFGYDQNDVLSDKKYIEPMQIIGDSILKFGFPVFEKTVSAGEQAIIRDPKTKKPLPPVNKNKPKVFHRYVIEYRKGGTASVKYEADKNRILIEHVAPMDGKSHEVGFMKLPDGTYEALVWKNEKWIWEEMATVGDKDDNKPYQAVPVKQNKIIKP